MSRRVLSCSLVLESPLNEPFALSFRSFYLKSELSYCLEKQHPVIMKKTPTAAKLLSMIQPQTSSLFPTRNMLARNRLKKPLPDTVFRNKKCFIIKLKSQKERTRIIPNRLQNRYTHLVEDDQIFCRLTFRRL